MSYIKITANNQIVLPKEARDAMKVKRGDQILVVVKGQTAVLMPKPLSYAIALSGKGKAIFTENYLTKERRSW